MLLNRTLGSTLLLSALCLGSARPPAPQPGAQPSPLNVSMVQLIANPKAFHGKWVRVIGFCHLEFEGNALYLHRDDYERAISRNGVWLNAPEGKEGLSNQYVLVEGVFEDANNEYEAGFSGKLTRVFRMEAWASRQEAPKVFKKK